MIVGSFQTHDLCENVGQFTTEICEFSPTYLSVAGKILNKSELRSTHCRQAKMALSSPS